MITFWFATKIFFNRCCAGRSNKTVTVRRCAVIFKLIDPLFICILSKHSSPNSFWIISILSAQLFLSLKQNLIQIRCLHFFMIFSDNKIRRTQKTQCKQKYAVSKLVSGYARISQVGSNEDIKSRILVGRIFCDLYAENECNRFRSKKVDNTLIKFL